MQKLIRGHEPGCRLFVRRQTFARFHPVTSRLRCWLAGISLSVCSLVRGAETSPASLAPLPTPIALSADLRAAGAKTGIPVGPFTLVLEPGAPRLGDGVVVLITLTNGSAQKQWLAQFEIDPLTT